MNETTIANEEFVRNVIFLEDMDKIIAVFPFFHDIQPDAFDQLLDTAPDSEIFMKIEKKEDLCLIYENVFGWGWISKNLLGELQLPTKEKYKSLKDELISIKFIKPSFILNEDYNE